jgi:hypothetical protein
MMLIFSADVMEDKKKREANREVYFLAVCPEWNNGQ